MSGNRPFFADPAPEDFQNPDTAPEDFQNPDTAPEDFQNPDTAPEDFQNPDTAPEDFQNPDTNVAYALRLLQERLVGGRRGGRRRRRGGNDVPQRPQHLDQTSYKADYSGFIVVRLAGYLDLAEARGEETLADLADKLDLDGLAQVLDRHGLTSSRRLVENAVNNDDPEYQGCECVRQSEKHGRCSCRRCNTVDELEKKAASSVLPPLHSLLSYWRIDVRGKTKGPKLLRGELSLNGWDPGPVHTVRKIVQQLNELDEVDRAYRELAVTDPAPDHPVSNDTYAVIQEYLERAPVGIDVRWARSQEDGKGSGPVLVDLEQGWIPEHRDLSHRDMDPLVVVGDNRHNKGKYRGHHGTAVLGEIVAEEDNELGVVGIAPRVRRVLRVSHYRDKDQTNLNVAEGIRQAVPLMDPGDVLLLEVQRSYLPTEVDDADRDAIRMAVANGIIVVEAAGNGEADLDRYIDEEGDRVLNRRSPTFVESGAIMVSAARADLPHNRFAGPVGVGSNYGSRIDCFGYGTGVVTTGYGRLDVEPDDDENTAAGQAYTDNFGGTSGAAPIIAGAALVVQGMYQARCAVRLSPWEMRGILSDPRLGTRQGTGVRGRIGVMPDLRAILRDRLQLAPDIYLRDHLEDNGARPARSRIGASPDIIVVNKKIASSSFGEASGTENSYVGCFKPRPGEDHLLYLRMRNRGLLAAPQPKATLYWSEVATLVRPDKWNEIAAAQALKIAPAGGNVAGGDVVGGDVAGGDTLAVSAPIVLPKPELLTSEGDSSNEAVHRCFVAVLRDPEEHEPGHERLVMPPFHPPYFDWHEFRKFLREHNDVAIRNVHLVDVDELPSGHDKGLELPFRLAGTPDLARVFDFEIVQRLPAGAGVQLDVPPPLAARMLRRRLWNVGPQPDRPGSRLDLPLQPRIGVGRVRLIAGAWFDCRFRVHGAGIISEGHSLTIRQLYRGEEVGRITWLFRSRSEPDSVNS